MYPEVCCMEPENYKKFFRAVYWSGVRKVDRKPCKNRCGKRDRPRKLINSRIAVCNAPSLLANASQFAVYATVRQSVLNKWKFLNNSYCEQSDDSDTEEDSSPALLEAKVPKITGIGLHSVFALISSARYIDTSFCSEAMKALLDILQGHTPEELSQEPFEIIQDLHAVLAEVSNTNGPSDRPVQPTNLTSLSSSCLIALSIARGETELLLNAVLSLIMSQPSLSEQYIQIPVNLISLQRSVQSVILGTPSRNLWLNFGIPNQSLVTSFPVDLPTQLTSLHGDLIVRSLASDGCYLYVFTSRGLIKIGSGYGSSIRQHVYLYKSDFFCTERHGWLGYCKDKLYVRLGRKKTELYEVDKDTLEVKNVVKLEPGPQTLADSKTAVFSDGNQLGVVALTSFDNLSIRLYDLESSEEETTLRSRKELNVHLLRERTLALGRSPFEDPTSRRALDVDTPYAIQLDENDDDPLQSIAVGTDFALLLTRSGKVYYSGKGTSLGYKLPTPELGRWTLMKETSILKSDSHSVKKCKVVQVAVGHEGVHAVIVLDNGMALFVGLSRKGEDGDTAKYRRAPKPTRPKVMPKVEGLHIIYAACNYGTSALITQQGQLLMFGKDTMNCDVNGVVTGLKYETVTKVALGKAHAVVLTSNGLVYTFGINNRGQCGRDFVNIKEKGPVAIKRQQQVKQEFGPELCPLGTHKFKSDYCRVCVICLECTGFSNACQCSEFPNRVPKEKCGCGEGDSGCIECGVCRFCAECQVAPKSQEDSDIDAPSCSESRTVTDKDDKVTNVEPKPGCSDAEKESNVKSSCLQPGRVAIPGGHKISAIACGMHHTVLLTQHGDVLTFGSNQFGQLGTGDISIHHRLIRVRVPRASAIAAGSNHTALVTREGELYTFGSYEKGALGRPRLDDSPSRSDKLPIWHASPGRVPRLGPKHSCKAVTVSASGDQTFVHVSQALIKTDTLFSSTITANNNTIVILPNRPEHTFKCITINKADGSCNTWTGAEQVDFVNSLTCLDPFYDVLWCYQPQIKVMKCFNILAFDSHKLLKCCVNEPEIVGDTENEYEYPNYGNMKRMEDFKNLETVEVLCNVEEKQIDNVALTNMSILNQELAIPAIVGCTVTRMHAALHLLGCLDSLTYAHDSKLCLAEYKKDTSQAPNLVGNNDYQTVNRFESHGGGWGYSGHSIEAIRFMCDADILLGGFGLYGGRGDYTTRIKIFDIGPEGGELEGDGEIIAESEEIIYECSPRDKFPVLFENPITILANKWYVAWAAVNGPSSDCGASGKSMVINDDIAFHFKSSKKSNNGTDVNAGQIPCLLYNPLSPDHSRSSKNSDQTDPVVILTKNLSRKVTVPCFYSLISLLRWSWDTLKVTLLDTNGQLPINYQKLTIMKHQKRLVYVIRACMRLVKSYINEVFPQHAKKRNTGEYMQYFDAIGEIRNLIQTILSEATPTCNMLPRKSGKNKAHRVCYVQFALEMINSIHKECHETIIECFHAFFPTPILKWNHLCCLLFNVQDGMVPPVHIRELTSTCAALCSSRSLRDVLAYIVPLTQATLALNEPRRSESKIQKMENGSKSATVPRSSHQKPPPVPPRVTSRDVQQRGAGTSENKTSYKDWHLMDVLPRVLDVVMLPIKQLMMTRQCGQPHDHGEVKQNERLSNNCCKFLARVVAELSYSATHVKDEVNAPGSSQYMATPSRFMRVNQSRVWNTGNGSPDAICFSVDKSGISLVGVGVYGGLGNFEYELELLHDDRLAVPSGSEDVASHCWVSLEVTQGTFTSSDCQNDIVHLKFERPVPLKDNNRYAVRLCNNGGRTSNGDCGLPSLKGPDGTNFRFMSSSLSFNGTTLARGQIPCLLYYGYSLSNTESTDVMLGALRSITLNVASIIMGRSADLLCSLRNEITTEDLKRNSSALQNSPTINTLLPFTLANLEGLTDPKSSVQLLEIVHKVLPHVAAMNQLLPTIDEPGNSLPPSTTAKYYTYVESDHPYKQAAVQNIRVLFPSNVSWIILEMDPRSVTGQPEDTLTVYAVAGTPRPRCNCMAGSRNTNSPFKKRYVQLTNETGEVVESELCDDASEDARCLQYNCTYVAVTPKLSNVHRDWPQQGILVPGNEVIFSLETASDYLNEYNKGDSEATHFGFRCLCVGHDDVSFTSQRQGLSALEMELAYAGAACAARLLAPNIDLPTVNQAIVAEVLGSALKGMVSYNSAEAPELSQDASETVLISRGIELAASPTIHQVLDGQPLMRCVSTERQFLLDFVSGAEKTAGGRLARWLAPCSRVDPEKCELKSPSTPPRPANKTTLSVIVRDQYGEVVSSPALNAQVIVQRLEDGEALKNRMSTSDTGFAIPDVSYQPTVRDMMRFHAITFIKAYQNYSFEELRFASGTWGGITEGNVITTGRTPVERLTVKIMADGTSVASWIPRSSGTYSLRCTLDDRPAPQELMLEVLECAAEAELDPAAGNVSPTPKKLKRFPGKFSSGLRVRSSPSLQAEEIGCVCPGSVVSFVEELENKDGNWVRLTDESIEAFAEGSGSIAWCLQYHRHLDLVLLESMEPWTASLTPNKPSTSWNGLPGLNWAREVELDDEQNQIEEVKIPVPLQDDDGNDSDSSGNSSGSEPNMRRRLVRNCNNPNLSPRYGRNNGNSVLEEFWSPERRAPIIVPAEPDEDDEEPQEVLPAPGVAQAGTQTSPEEPEAPVQANIIVEQGLAEAVAVAPVVSEAEVMKPIAGPSTSSQSYAHLGAIPKTKSMAREQVEMRSRFKRNSTSPPPVPARNKTPVPKKNAVSPSQAECLRALFAALLWHEGIVHDAIAGSAFLKFHPNLPKSGAPVVTRSSHNDVMHRQQRHSVEVSSAGQYLRIPDSSLETLTRSGMEASASRNRNHRAAAEVPHPPINEEDSQSNDNVTEGGDGDDDQRGVVNVLPPVLRAIVALWDTLSNAEQLTTATDRYQRKSDMGNYDDAFDKIQRRKKERKTCNTFYYVGCELCAGTMVLPPLITHLRDSHPGCKVLTIHGYTHGGIYKRADSYASVALPVAAAVSTAPCGTMSKTFHLLYMFCEKCRDKALKASSKIPKLKVIGESGSSIDKEMPDIDHYVMKENALFLLDLAPLNNSEALSESPWRERSARVGATSPPAPGMWRPPPPFQCLGSLGAPSSRTLRPDIAKYHSLGRPQASAAASNYPYGGNEPSNAGEGSSTISRRVPRSISMGNAEAMQVAYSSQLDADSKEESSIKHEPLSGAGSSLIAQPSKALLRLVNCDGWNAGVSALETPQLDPQSLVTRPVLKFVLTKRDLYSSKQKMDAAIRINTVRQYALEALNWMLRSVTQPICVHDIMWWFCTALDKYARLTPEPLTSNDENAREAARAETIRYINNTASAAALCPGGLSGRNARVALHAFLASVSTLAPNLPPTSASTLQAVRCWALHYSPHDRIFLHRSQVFSVISKILSQSEDGFDDLLLGALNDSFQSNSDKENYIWACPDVTSWCDVTVSSRLAMAGALTDGSTETFWESGDEDRNKAKWIQISYPGSCADDRPHLVCFHIDNTRDTVNKTFLLSFLYSEGSRELYHLQDIEVDSKAADWFCCPLPRVSGLALRVRCELRGPEPSVRVRQLRVLAAPSPVSHPPSISPMRLMHSLVESETLRVFRLVTSQVFGKLLEWDRCLWEPELETAAGAESPTGDSNDTDLREHVVGILFAGNQMTTLQSQVMSHIVIAIGSEAVRSRDDWETNLLCIDVNEKAETDSNPPLLMPTVAQDNYCFEMLSLLLALSGSDVGCAHLVLKSELLSDLLSLLHTGSDRVQRQVICLLRRMITGIPPKRAYAALNYGSDDREQVTLLDHLLSYISKAITIQVKIKGNGGSTPKTAVMGGNLDSTSTVHWFMRSQTSKKHAQMVVKLLADMADGKLSDAWRVETRAVLASAPVRMASVDETARQPARCVASPEMWIALAALCVCETNYLELLNGSPDARGRDNTESRPYCSNHDDGETIAVIDCNSCGPLCHECDRFLHLNRAARSHHRQICKEEESAVRIDIHEGCGRAKLFWLLLLVDRRTLKGLAEFRAVSQASVSQPGPQQAPAGGGGHMGVCRFCGTRGTTGLLAIGNVCADQQCQEHSGSACSHILTCGHQCGGVRGERSCLPCLFGCTPPSSAAPLRQDADDMCMICFTDPLQAAPAVQLKCGHLFHQHCCKNVINNKWNGPRITFSFSQCPICKEDMSHWTLEELLSPIRRLQDEVRRKALMRLEYEGLAASEGRTRSGTDPATYAMERYAYYVCHKCGKAYFGGLARCEVETNSVYEPSELVCGACSDIAGARTCPKHGADFLEYKCRYCCSVAVFFCFGTSHFCNSCHDDFQRVTNMPKSSLPQCPAGPKGMQLPGSAEECPLHVTHPPTGEEFALGCGVCRNAHAF